MIRRAIDKLRGGQKPSITPDLERRIRRSFDESSADEEHFPSTIDPRIYHVQLLLRFFGDLEGARVLDAGCGKGRFARVFLDHYPAARISACDISTAMLQFVQSPLAPCAATMTALPYRDAAFDAVYATESLEHAVDIERAVAELCRVTRAGGKIAVIDKNAEHWGKLETPEWERWFHPKELEKLLRRHCSKVESRFISYWEDVAPDGLFVAWLAER
ncbi:MAG: methyltransferase domain-containing protein [Bryobacterales bacterium]|nr:methyltransferase domain-containing protein [Bryobacterales bacterium]